MGVFSVLFLFLFLSFFLFWKKNPVGSKMARVFLRGVKESGRSACLPSWAIFAS